MATYQNSRYNIALPSGSGGSLVHIKTLTASSSANLSFVDGSSDVVLDNTYRTYLFKLINLHPATDDTVLQVNFRDGGSSYDATKTSTFFNASHDEGGTATGLAYVASGAGEDLAQSTGVQEMTRSIGADADQCASGELWLYNPSSTTFVKHFIAVSSNNYGGDTYYMNNYIAGYGNTTSAVDAVQFSMSSGNIDAGTVQLFGVN